MADESFVLVGTPFPQIKKTDEFGDPKRPNPTRDLEVRDEQGRRRFHGAFTGGFSAGYFNTVGSKEGWAPSEFVSSRDKRSERKMNRPEDFMDEEDKQTLKESSRLMTSEDFDTLGSTRKEMNLKRATARNMHTSGGALGVLPDRIIDDLIVPSSEPVGIRLLKRMGWKQGQGIGPRVTKKQKKSRHHGPSDNDDDDDTPDNITFAPIDSAIVVFTNKSNVFGLGFDPYKNAPEFDTRLQRQSGSKYLSEADGRSARPGLEFGKFDSDDDDDDVYGQGPKTSLEFDIDAPGSTSGRGKGRRSQEKALTSLDTDATVPEYCSDGRPPLQGFVLGATAGVKPLKWYSAPRVPDDFVPHHVFSEHTKPTPISNRQQQPKLTADDRALVLGETPIVAPRRSVFEYMSAENKNRLDSVLGFVMDTEGEKHMKKNHFDIPTIDKSSAEAALQGFMPFGDNLAKQSRYKQYLNIQAKRSDETITLVEGFSGTDMTRELNEFAQAARIFKPLSTSMASRFTAASSVIEFAQPAAGLRSSADIIASAADKSTPMHAVVERMEVPKSQAAKAAAMGMFGPLTRSTVDFFPAKLLCKRFNVPNPHPDHKDKGPEGPRDLLDKMTMDNMMARRGAYEGMVGEGQGSLSGTSTPKEESGTASSAVAADLEEANEDVAQVRPPMDIFKAIFDDSEEEEEESDAETPENTSADHDKDTAHMDSTAREPRRPVFTRKSERGLDSGRIDRGSVLKKVEISHIDEDEDENEFGPKLSISKVVPDRRSKSGSSSTSKIRKVEKHFEKDTRTLERSESTSKLLFLEMGPKDSEVTPEGTTTTSQRTSGQQEDNGRSTSRKQLHRLSQSPSRSPSPSRSEPRDMSTKKHKSHHSSSRTESDLHRSSQSSSQQRSISRDRSHTSGTKSSRRREEDGERSRRSEGGNSSSKRKRHREHRSRSRSPKKNSRDKDRDRDNDSRHSHGKKSKSSRSDRDRDRYSSTSSGRAKTNDTTYYGQDDDDDMWVEKQVDIPVSPATAPPSRGTSHRPRAAEFF
ncbi:hypothetical protein BG004_005661 [Podila humilis]|nr:hypothetical protein BG004_005661 [Podila humilis]